MNETEIKIFRFLKRFGRIANYKFDDPEIDNMKEWNYGYRIALIHEKLDKAEYLRLENEFLIARESKDPQYKQEFLLKSTEHLRKIFASK